MLNISLYLHLLILQLLFLMHPTSLLKQEAGKPSLNAAQPCANAQGCINDDLRADGL